MTIFASLLPVPEQPGVSLSFDEVLDRRAVRAVFQPLVDLTSGEVVGFEALARGPRGSAWERPDVLFAAARERGRLGELDWVCRAAAYAGALRARLAPGLALFVNSEAEAFGSPCPGDLQALVEQAEGSLQVVTEMTERALTRDPAGLLAAAAGARAVGWGVAMDDVGAEPASLALMPFVHPDVIKLDMGLVQAPAGAAAAATAGAVMAQAERTGARVLAEGIETDEHRQRALSLGASVGQGWLFGRPGPLPTVTRRPTRPVALLAPDPLPALTPFQLVAGRAALQVATKALLLPLSRHLERRALDDGEPPIVLATFQDAGHFTPATAARYASLCNRSALVAVLAADMLATPAGRVRGAALAGTDPLGTEWDVVVVGPHYAAALLSRDLGDTDVEDADRRFEFTVTHDRALVLQAARALLLRVLPDTITT